MLVHQTLASSRHFRGCKKETDPSLIGAKPNTTNERNASGTHIGKTCHRAVLDLPNIAVANAADNYQYNQYQVVSNFLRLFKPK
jgi:hypothetical protein